MAIASLYPANSAQALGEKHKRDSRCSVVAQDNSTTQKAEQPDINSNISEWLLNERVIVLSKEIDAELAEAVIPQLLYLDRKAPGKDIYVYINSPGGEITSGMAIYDTMRSLKSDVVTVSIGEASSMASILLAGGTKGKRLALPNSRIMIHQPLGGAGGQATEAEIEIKELLYQKKQLTQLLSQNTGQSLKRIATDTDRNFYMSAQEAKAYGIVDQVVKQLPSASRP
ncbi:MAG: ATP-dependent Clp protease proteolytic subunit [Stenomitos rutilans HA7619-LM2]|nr:ATP-dependent Clp protease proteolytic subunit [Stenomitos rutilans HA7619-LM2]